MTLLLVVEQTAPAISVLISRSSGVVTGNTSPMTGCDNTRRP
ncbi:uncharacterized protein METZ01_LOCUS338295, partial [marine metagenome]